MCGSYPSQKMQKVNLHICYSNSVTIIRLPVQLLLFGLHGAVVKSQIALPGQWSANVHCSCGCYAGSLKGFGFATFMTRGHAESAIKNTNGKVTHYGSTYKRFDIPHLGCDMFCHALQNSCCAVERALTCTGSNYPLSACSNSAQEHCLAPTLINCLSYRW